VVPILYIYIQLLDMEINTIRKKGHDYEYISEYLSLIIHYWLLLILMLNLYVCIG